MSSSSSKWEVGGLVLLVGGKPLKPKQHNKCNMKNKKIFLLRAKLKKLIRMQKKHWAHSENLRGQILQSIVVVMLGKLTIIRWKASIKTDLFYELNHHEMYILLYNMYNYTIFPVTYTNIYETDFFNVPCSRNHLKL